MANNRKITEIIADVPNEIFNKAMLDAGVSYQNTTTVMSGLSQTCKPLNLFFEQPLANRMLVTLCQAVLDDHREQARKIINTNPNLLCIPLPNVIIESKFTFQRFYDVSPLMIAVKRRQIEMMKLMIECCDQSLEVKQATLAKSKILFAGSLYPTQLNAEGKEEIVIPPNYAKFAKELIDVFSEEGFVGGKLNEKTTLALQLLFNTLLPNEAVKLEDYLDVELFLLALYQAYYDHFNTFQNWDQRDAFCIRVIGLVQSVLSPETAKIFCEGLDDVVTALSNGKERKLSEQALKHLLKDGTAFYRLSRYSQAGQGANFLCGIYARGFGVTAGDLPHLAAAWRSYVEQKLQTCKTYAARAEESVSVVRDFMR